MYDIHGKACQDFAQENADNMALVIMMVSLSIQQSWLKIGIQVQDVILNGASSRFLTWKMKQDTYQYVQANKHDLYHDMMNIIEMEAPCNNSRQYKALCLMETFLKIPGLNISKAGFVCQLVAGLVGCMDSWNLKYYNINPNVTQFNKKVKTTRGEVNNLKKLTKYISICHDIGTDRLWDTWCNMIAANYKEWRSGNEVSKAHIDYLRGE